MEEIKEESCSTNAKKCCVKGIVLIIICSIVCFFLGYYVGAKSNIRGIGPRISRPFNPNRPRPDLRRNQNTPARNRIPRQDLQQPAQRMRDADLAKPPQRRVPPVNQRNAVKPKTSTQQPANKK